MMGRQTGIILSRVVVALLGVATAHGNDSGGEDSSAV